MKKESGNIDEISLVLVTVLPEVVGREIGCYSLADHLQDVKSIESCCWPMRRALADVEETDPLDDDRVDAQLIPFLANLCRACQAVIDGVLIELRLKRNCRSVIGLKMNMLTEKKEQITESMVLPLSWTFDADEESLLEAANFFVPEISPLQRLRWLMTLKQLHELKGQWLEAAETLILCARTITDAIPHVKELWRPSRFMLWYDPRCSPWISSIGEDCTTPEKNENSQVMEFADAFLEPLDLQNLLGSSIDQKDTRLKQPTILVMCQIITLVTKEAIDRYHQESGMESLVFSKLEKLLQSVIGVTECHSTIRSDRNRTRNSRARTKAFEENAALRNMSAAINELIAKLSDRISTKRLDSYENKQSYVRIILLGKKSNRFIESTTIPTYLGWETPYICRVPKEIIKKVITNKEFHSATDELIEEEICRIFAHPYLLALNEDLTHCNLEFCTAMPDQEAIELKGENVMFFVVTMVHAKSLSFNCKKFVFKRNTHSYDGDSHFIEMTVAQKFPYALSRQPTLISTEYSQR